MQIQENAVPEKNRYTLMVLGSQQVGKSAIVRRFLHENFRDRYIPTLEESHRKIYSVASELFMLEVVEVGGVDPNQWWRKYSLPLADLYLLLYSIDNHHSFERCLKFREEILAARSEMINRGYKKAAKSLQRADVPLVIMANKADLPVVDRLVEQREAQEALRGLGNCAFFEASAKADTNVNEAFSELFRLAKLPPELSPHMHKCATVENSVSARAKGEAWCVLSDNRRKPSIVNDFWFLQRIDQRHRSANADESGETGRAEVKHVVRANTSRTAQELPE